MIVLAIDPGPVQSASVHYSDGIGIIAKRTWRNDDLVGLLAENCWGSDTLAIEMIASYGMPVGREVFETCVWIGRFTQAWTGGPVQYVYRRDVKLHLCGSVRARDASVRQALLDRWGGREKAVGNKRAPGPLYGVSGDVWQALAVAVTFADGAVK